MSFIVILIPWIILIILFRFKHCLHGKAGSHNLGETENESWGAILDGTFPDSYQWDKSLVSNGGTTLQPVVAYPDRQKNFYQNGFSQSNNVAFDGNYDKANFRVSLGNLTNEGIMPNTDYSRKTIGVNGIYNLADNLKISAAVNITESGSDNRQNISTEEKTLRSVLKWAYR